MNILPVNRIKRKTSFLYLFFLLLILGCIDSKKSTLNKEGQIQATKDSIVVQKTNKYKPTNTFSFGYWGDMGQEFNVSKFYNLLQNDSIKSAYKYLKENKPSETDSVNFSAYKSNLSNILICQGKFKKSIELLNEVINTKDSSTTIPERLLRSEAFVQINQIDSAMIDLSYIIENGGRYSWRAYRQRGIIKYEILKDSFGGCEDLKKGAVNDYAMKIFKKYCHNKMEIY